MRHVFISITTVAILLLTGCASVVPTAPIDQDIKAKEFFPAPNKASLYIYRNEGFGAGIPMTVVVNGRALGQTGAQTYFRLSVMPGKYNVESHAENVSSLSLSVEGGKNYFVWQEVKMGMWMARSLLQQVDEKTGRAGVMESKLIASSVSDNDLIPLDMPAAIPSPSDMPSSNTSINEKLRELQKLRNDGIITEEEFQKKKQQLLEKF